MFTSVINIDAEEKSRYVDNRNVLSECYLDYETDLSSAQSKFARDGYLYLPQFLNSATFNTIVQEVMSQLDLLSYRNFVMPSSNTPRHMSTIGGRKIKERHPYLYALYHNESINRFVSSIIGKPVFECLHPNEYAVINYQQGRKQTHGWHLDDPDYAIVIALRSPKKGGTVQMYPEYDSSFIENETTLMSVMDRAIKSRRIKSLTLNTTDAYLLHASRIPHRVKACASDNDYRLAINFAYCGQPNQEYGDSADLLYGELDRSLEGK